MYPGSMYDIFFFLQFYVQFQLVLLYTCTTCTVVYVYMNVYDDVEFFIYNFIFNFSQLVLLYHM